jgi:hypothetical protein
LSAWLADKLSATELIMIKSAVVDARLSLQQLAELDVVDKAFCGFVSQATFKTHLINALGFVAR